MKVEIVKIHRADKDKEGKPYTTKDGRPYTRVGIQTKEHGTKWLSGFENFTTKNWVEGQEVEVDVETKGEYLNFKTLSETGKIWKELNRQATEIVNLKRAFEQFQGLPQQDEFGVPKETEEEDLPF